MFYPVKGPRNHAAGNFVGSVPPDNFIRGGPLEVPAPVEMLILKKRSLVVNRTSVTRCIILVRFGVSTHRRRHH